MRRRTWNRACEMSEEGWREGRAENRGYFIWYINLEYIIYLVHDEFRSGQEES